MARRRKGNEQAEPEPDTLQRIRTGTERNPPPKSPLGKEHLTALNTVIDECTKTHAMCAACGDAGIDVEPEQKLNAEQLEMAKKLKALFFPHAT